MSTGKALLGVLAGIAAGAAMGILFAPKKGSDTRRDISKKADDLADALKSKIDEKFDDLIDAISARGSKSKSQNDYGKGKETESAAR